MNSEYQTFLEIIKDGVQRVISTTCNMSPDGKAHPNSRSHNHLRKEILFVLDGESDYMLNGNWYYLKPGDAVFIDSWEEHSLYYRPEEHDLKHLWLSSSPKHLNVIYTSLNDKGELDGKVYCKGCTGPVFQNLVKNWDRSRTPKTTDDYLCRQLLRTSLNQVLFEIAYKLMTQENVHQKNPTEEIIEFISEYIYKNHGNNCTLPQLAKLSGYTHYYLSHLFRKYQGKTIGTAINEARLAYLSGQKSHVNSKELAEKLGFGSVDTFWKWRRNNLNQDEMLEN